MGSVCSVQPSPASPFHEHFDMSMTFTYPRTSLAIHDTTTAKVTPSRTSSHRTASSEDGDEEPERAPMQLGSCGSPVMMMRARTREQPTPLLRLGDSDVSAKFDREMSPSGSIGPETPRDFFSKAHLPNLTPDAGHPEQIRMSSACHIATLRNGLARPRSRSFDPCPPTVNGNASQRPGLLAGGRPRALTFKVQRTGTGLGSLSPSKMTNSSLSRQSTLHEMDARSIEHTRLPLSHGVRQLRMMTSMPSSSRGQVYLPSVLPPTRVTRASSP
jgi:hypothetical protein